MTKNLPVVFATENDVPREIRAAKRAVEDARAYVAKPPTANLSKFRNDFLRPIFEPVLKEAGLDAKTIEAVLAYAPAMAGTYSRYQDASRAGLLGEIATPTAYRIGTAPKPRAPKAPAKPKTEAPTA